MTQEEIKERLTHYYEIDLDNCTFTHEDWIDELAESMANPKRYLAKFLKEYLIYKNDRL